MSEQNKSAHEQGAKGLTPTSHQVDLREAADLLQAEPLKNRPRRQKVLYRQGPMTVALFLFDSGASLPPHAAQGVVSVQVLQGRLRMNVEADAHDLPAGSLLFLPAGAKHDVLAVEATQMLLTMCADSKDKPAVSAKL